MSESSLSRKDLAVQLKVVRFVPACACGFAAAFGILFGGSPVAAQTVYYWTTSPSSIVGGGGSWDSSTANWTQYDPGGGNNVAWVSGANADFSGTGGAVSVSGNQSVNAIQFDGSGYAFTGGTLTLGAGNITANQNATIGSYLVATGGLTTSGNGTLTITNSVGLASTYSNGIVTVHQAR